jgi:hypothetical protein
MLMCTMSHKLAGGTPLQQCRMNNVKWEQRARLITGLGIAVMIFILLCTVACGGGSDVSLAKGGINMIVVSGQARIQSGEGNTSVVEGQEAVLTTGDQIMADGAGAKLLLVDGSLLDLKPDTDLQVITFSAEGTAKLRQLKGRLEVQAASPLLTIEVSTFGSEGSASKTMRFTATPTVRETAFGLEIDGLNAHLTVEAGGVNVTDDNGMETIPAGSEVKVTSEGLIVPPTETPVEPTVVVVATDNLAPTPTATAAATPTPEPLPAPGLVGPGDGSNFKPSDDILLIWDTPTSLSEDEWYEVQLWREGDVPYTVAQRTKEGTWKVERDYYPGRYQWRILIVLGQEGQRDLSRPSQTWSFSWLSPVVPAPTAPTSPSDKVAPVDLTVYLRGTNNPEGLATFSAEHVDAGLIYAEEGTVYGDVAVRIGDAMYHFDKEPAPGEPEQLPAPYRLDVKFSDSLIAATEGIIPGFNPQKAQFWVGTLNCNSAVSEPYRIEMTLSAGGEARKHTEISFLVTDNPLCGVGPEPEEGGGGGGGPPVRP